MAFTRQDLENMGMNEYQIDAMLSAQEIQQNKEPNVENETLPVTLDKVVQLHQHNVEVHSSEPLVPTSLEQLKVYKEGAIVELPPFADGQPFIARMSRPSMLALVKSGKIPNTLLNQATSLFANGANALNGTGKNATNVNELFDVIDVIVDAALLEPTLEDIHSVGLELTDDQLMAIFSYTQRGIRALESFRTK